MVFKEKPKSWSPKVRVVSCFIEFEGKFLSVLRQNLKPEGNKWGVPAGKVEPGESPRHAIAREIKEEVGLDIQENQQLFYFGTVYVRYPNIDFDFEIWSAKLESKPIVVLNYEEHKDYKWNTPLEALKDNLVLDEPECIKLFYNL